MQRLCTCIFEAGVYEHVMIVYKSCSSRVFSYSALYFFEPFSADFVNGFRPAFAGHAKSCSSVEICSSFEVFDA